jgi:hypothetical protein
MATASGHSSRAQEWPVEEGATSSDVFRAPNVTKSAIHGCFERLERGVYTVSPTGRRGLEMFARPGA